MLWSLSVSRSSESSVIRILPILMVIYHKYNKHHLKGETNGLPCVLNLAIGNSLYVNSDQKYGKIYLNWLEKTKLILPTQWTLPTQSWTQVFSETFGKYAKICYRSICLYFC